MNKGGQGFALAKYWLYANGLEYQQPCSPSQNCQNTSAVLTSWIEGTGGVRKLHWGRGAQGKSGGVRVIYYMHSDAMPLYLLTLFAKNERANLTKAERNELGDLVDLLVEI